MAFAPPPWLYSAVVPRVFMQGATLVKAKETTKTELILDACFDIMDISDRVKFL